jgi:hypothetical protein
MTGIVERMARAICESVGPEESADAKSQMGDWPAWRDWRPQARAGLAAIRPEDVSDEMLVAAIEVIGFAKIPSDQLRRAIAASINAEVKP